MPVDPKQFWEDKLLTWEQGRYGKPERPLGLLEWIANRSSMSLRYRVAITPELLKPFLAGKRVVELGCGSGLLAAKLIEYGAASYLGIDIAETAIRKARESHGGRDARIAFAVGGVADLQPLAADLVISLGLLDWLRDDEIANVFAKSGRRISCMPSPSGGLASSSGCIAPMSSSPTAIAPPATGRAISLARTSRRWPPRPFRAASTSIATGD